MYLINRVERCPPWVGLLFLLPLSICIHSSSPRHSHLLIFKFQRLLHFVKFLPSSSPHFNPRLMHFTFRLYVCHQWSHIYHEMLLFTLCSSMQYAQYYLISVLWCSKTSLSNFILRSFNLTQKYLTSALADLTLPLNEIFELLSFLTSLPRALKTGLYFISTACLVFSWT